MHALHRHLRRGATWGSSDQEYGFMPAPRGLPSQQATPAGNHTAPLVCRIPTATGIITYPDAGHASIFQHGLTNAFLLNAWLAQDQVEATGAVQDV